MSVCARHGVHWVNNVAVVYNFGKAVFQIGGRSQIVVGCMVRRDKRIKGKIKFAQEVCFYRDSCRTGFL